MSFKELKITRLSSQSSARYLSFILFLSIQFLSYSQDSLHDLLEKYNKESVRYIYVSELAKIQSDVVILDAREPGEYNVSHIKDAIPVGFNNFNNNVLNEINQDTVIVVYCSLGVRSERIGEKIKKLGYSVYNLYGGIFEWKNSGYDVYDTNNKITENVHAYSEEWSKWLLKGNKIYD
ncbi:rhodanese-like domain-containing protein [Winogradskyella poriferorum]|uniref:rhodanese-like domain-containing protein n=1 Tax=Winogradskyella poriferorum TaxID=307627 RepID=UPI003D662461